MKTPLSTRSKAFTLVELLVSMAIIAILVIVLASITDTTRRTWAYTKNKIEQFRDAREAFEEITRRLSQATLNTYWDYDNPTAPTNYVRQSELRFVSGNATDLGWPSNIYTHAVFFQAPLGLVYDANYSGLANLLNTWGYYVSYLDDSYLRPPFITQTVAPYRKRFRLMQVMMPSENFTLYDREIKAGGNAKYTGNEWYLADSNTTTAGSGFRQDLVDNIIALIILPKLSPADQTAGGYSDSSLAPFYLYDSTGKAMTTLNDANLNPKNQLPPVLQVSMVAIDEVSASKMTDANNAALQAKLRSIFVQSKDLTKDLIRDTKTYPATSNDPSLEAYLISNKINYRIFTTNVSIKAAKWSRSQKG